MILSQLMTLQAIYSQSHHDSSILPPLSAFTGMSHMSHIYSWFHMSKRSPKADWLSENEVAGTFSFSEHKRLTYCRCNCYTRFNGKTHGASVKMCLHFLVDSVHTHIYTQIGWLAGWKSTGRLDKFGVLIISHLGPEQISWREI